MTVAAIKDLLYRLADDALILGHRNSEWIGMGPILEEDIAFASMAQDEVGHALCYYQLLQELGEPEPDQAAFARSAEQFRCCHLVELPIGDYAFSLVRHYLFDMADMVRLRRLSESRYRHLAELARKLAREEKYHQMHARTFLQQLGRAGGEAQARLQAALDEAYPVAFSLFEPTLHSATLAQEGVQPLEDQLMKEWRQEVDPFLRSCGLLLPDPGDITEHFGGRGGRHTPHLAPLLAEMTEVFAIDPAAKW
ncbi:MAG: 1,2-phenylacetyl-CoA epoxidase subunit PaaC [Bacteroidia bacterium]|nr:1,2-phenylacetyl-CoA epoxidase subunit PaaC [Bacteroidia bacterium]